MEGHLTSSGQCEGSEPGHYGHVCDLIISADGELKAVIVSPKVGWGGHGYHNNYAYPFYGYGHGWNPGHDYYVSVPCVSVWRFSPNGP